MAAGELTQTQPEAGHGDHSAAEAGHGGHGPRSACLRTCLLLAVEPAPQSGPSPLGAVGRCAS